MFPDLPQPSAEEIAAQILQKDAHYAAIGRVAVNWSYFEHEIDQRCIELGELPLLQAICLAAQISGHSRKLDAYIAIANLYQPPARLLTALEKLAEDARAIAERRNRVVHDPWIIVSAETKALRLETTARKKLRIDLVPYPTPKVVKLGKDIDALSSRFSALANDLRDARDASFGR